MPTLTEEEIQGFWSQVDKTDLHWYWMGSQTTNGYGIFYQKGVRLFAHRISYELLVGEIPISKPELDHFCHIRNCVHPDHLLPTTRAGNIRTRQTHHWVRSAYVEGGKRAVNQLIKTICSNNHKVRLLMVEKDGGLKCFDCARESRLKNERKYNQQNKIIMSTETDFNLDIFIRDYCKKFTKGNAKAAIKIKLFQAGINAYPKRVLQAMKYIDQCLPNNQNSLKEIAEFFNLKHNETKLFPDKQPNFILSPPSVSKLI